MSDEVDLIKSCIDLNRNAQKMLYEKYAGKMLLVCYRYTGNKEDANDLIQEGFITVFSDIRKYAGTGSLEGWIRRIMVNKAINYYKKNKRYNENTYSISDIEDTFEEAEISAAESVSEFETVKHAGLTKEELIVALEQLEIKFRMVFNLFYFENYSHKEIGDTLHIDEKTSRTRLHRAKKILQAYLYDLCIRKNKNAVNFSN
jgi:RNA polymerase sigma-70 factor (ECF subfamily)